MKRCLVVPGMFVPFNNVAALLVYKQLRLLDLEYDVIALSEKEDPEIRQELEQDPCWKKFHVTWSDRYNNVLFSIHNVDLFKGLHHMKKYINDAVNMYRGQELLYTSSFPCYTTRVGTVLKKQHPEMKWIANFSDPINHSPYKYDKPTYDAYSLPEKIAFRLYCRYYVVDEDEAAAFEQADMLVFICEEQRDFMIEQYMKYFHNIPEETIRRKCVIVPLNYVPEWNDIRPMPVKKHEDIYVLSHFGRIYGLRLIEEFIQALALFRKKYPDFTLRVEQYGEFRKSDAVLIKQLGLEDAFLVHEAIPYQECIEKMNASDAVLLFDTIMPEDEYQPYLPSKMLEYSLLQKNVLGIAMPKSPSYRIMKQSDAIVCRYDRNDILKGMEDLLIYHVPSIVNYASTNEDAVQDLSKAIEAFH